MSRLNVEVPAPDGTAAASLHVPDGDGPWPGVILFADAFGTREAMSRMGDEIAALGYVVLVPDIYYRNAGYAPFDPKTAFSDEAERGRLYGLLGSLTNDRVAADATAYADFLLARPEVRGPAVGTTGYCSGGRLSLVAATALGRKIGAAASFHGGRIAVDGDPGSPHLAADRISAAVYVAGATEDGSFTAEQADLLRSSLSKAGVEHTVEFYDARHGFAVPDTMAYDEAAAARHYQALAALYGEHL